MRNQVQLITYPDALGGDLRALDELLATQLAGAFGGVHILPPYPSSGDRGFAPQTYFEIDPRFGDWDDVRRLGARFDVLLDVMVNHVSRRSTYFRDFEQRGRRSPHAEMFLTLDKVWPDGVPRPADLAQIFLRRPEHPFADVTVAETGELERVWATFGTRDWSEQIDLDVRSPVAQQLFRDILRQMHAHGVRALRLDAIAFVTKKAGTSCFFVEPEIYDFLDWFAAEAAPLGIELVPELHAPYDVQLKLARHGEQVYNFALPLLVLHALLTGRSQRLQQHLRCCPRRQITMLDCHDGIPVQPDLDGLLEIDEAQRVVQACLQRGANLSLIHSPAHRLRPDFDAHQINTTYYSALGESDEALIAARALQLFAPGVPQVYYVGLLGGANAPEEVERTGERRAINRRNYSLAEIEQALARPLVQRLLALLRFRNTCPAFDGEFTVHEAGEGQLRLAWQRGPSRAELRLDLLRPGAVISWVDAAGVARDYAP